MLQVSGFHRESSVFLQACFRPVCSCLHECDWLHSKWNPQWMLCTKTRLLNRYFQTSTKEKITYINLHPYLAVADPDLQIRGWGWSYRPRDGGGGGGRSQFFFCGLKMRGPVPRAIPLDPPQLRLDYQPFLGKFALFILERSRKLEPKHIPQLFLGYLMATLRSAIGQFFSLFY